MSCVRASGRGETVWACENEVFVNVGPNNGEMSAFSGRGCVLCVFVATRKGFEENV